jgi:hypothetical protein
VLNTFIMTRFYLQLALLFMISFSVIASGIHLRPYDDHGLRALLTAENCPMPCFMGIQPGVTKADQAVSLVEKSGWADKVEALQTNDGGISGLQWNWNDTAPGLHDRQRPARVQLYPAAKALSVPTVVSITTGTIEPVGTIFLLMGQPDSLEGSPASMTAGDLSLVNALFISNGLFIVATVACPTTEDHFWRAPMTVQVVSVKTAAQYTISHSVSTYC